MDLKHYSEMRLIGFIRLPKGSTTQTTALEGVDLIRSFSVTEVGAADLRCRYGIQDSQDQEERGRKGRRVTTTVFCLRQCTVDTVV